MVGNRTRIKIVKNKIAPPFKEAEFDIMFGKGISKSGDILDLATEIDVIKKSGSGYAYEGTKIGQGRENAKSYLESNPEIMEEVEKKVREHYALSDTKKEDDSSDLKLTPQKDGAEKTEKSEKTKTKKGENDAVESTQSEEPKTAEE